jgi:hypothetical protein
MAADPTCPRNRLGNRVEGNDRIERSNDDGGG